MQVFLPFVASLLFWLFTAGIEAATASATKNARVYDEPSASANVVCNITVNQNITVIGEVPYYYVVELHNAVAGEETIGYIYKGNLTIEESETSGENVAEEPKVTEPEATEVFETTVEATEP